MYQMPMIRNLFIYAQDGTLSPLHRSEISFVTRTEHSQMRAQCSQAKYDAMASNAALFLNHLTATWQGTCLVLRLMVGLCRMEG